MIKIENENFKILIDNKFIDLLIDIIKDPSDDSYLFINESI